jgi:membrane protease YdiL (CAAX protease family)
LLQSESCGIFAPSSNGRTTAFEAVYLGSNPSGASMSRYTLINFLELFLIFVFPILLLLTGVVPLSSRHVLVFFVLALVAFSIWQDKERWSWKRLGLRTDNLTRSMIPYTLVTSLGIGGLFILAIVLNKTPTANWISQPHFQLGFFLISAFQEFIFRGFLVPKLDSMVQSKILQLIINASLFSFLHVIFPNPLLILPLMFISGLVFVWIYKKYPNLYLITISHAILNFIAVLHCFVSFNQSC